MWRGGAGAKNNKMWTPQGRNVLHQGGFECIILWHGSNFKTLFCLGGGGFLWKLQASLSLSFRFDF